MQLALARGMECYFGSMSLPEKNPSGKTAVVTFSIPDLGICFKAPFESVDSNHRDYASLLALLEFIDSNQEYFSSHTYQIFGTNHKVINQVNQKESSPAMYAPLIEKTEVYRKKYRFSLDWVPSEKNPAYDTLFD